MAYTRKKEKSLFVLCGVFVGVILTSIVLSLLMLLQQKNPEEILKLQGTEQETAKQILCLVAKENIAKGSELKEDQFIAKKMEAYFVPENKLEFSMQVSNHVSAIDIEPNTVLTTSMFVQKDLYTNDTRYQDYSEIRLPIDLVKGDVVDVRMKRKGGDDYIILAKKEIIERANNTIWIMIDEIERMRMNQALLEFRNESAEIYTTEYISSIEQYTPSVTYLK